MASVVVPTADSRNASVAEDSLSLVGKRPGVFYRALASVSLSLLFVLIYGGSNFVASRVDGGSWFYSWELRIPFVPLLILPYLSIDLFFVASFFLCANKTELRAHCRRIAMAILAAGACFILFPLSTGYPAPAVDGWTGDLFRFLWSFDRPHNLVPSLHIALLSLLWSIYIRHTSGGTRAFVHIWFGLIFLSPLLTWQHHVVDVATGALLGQVCIFAFPQNCECGPTKSASANIKVGILYAAGSISVFVVALALGGWWFLLLWPCISLGAVAVAYFRGDSARIAHRDAQSARRQSRAARRPVDSRRWFSDRTLYRSASRARARSLCPLWQKQKQRGTQLWRLFLLRAGKGHRFAAALQGKRFLENGFDCGIGQSLSEESSPIPVIPCDSLQRRAPRCRYLGEIILDRNTRLNCEVPWTI